jgi:formylmethanofuran dehydrogenase subunit E
MRPFDDLLEESASFHGHPCPGQVLGVRLAMAGCKAVGIDEPKESKNLLVFVEIDRCATDAVQTVTGCKLGKRTLKFLDYGKVAATFLNLETQEAVRVAAREDSREAVRRYVPAGLDDKSAQFQAYKVMPDEELFTRASVRVEVPASDLPGKPLSRARCDGCGEGVNDSREVLAQGRTLCRACANGAYYQAPEPALDQHDG